MRNNILLRNKKINLGCNINKDIDEIDDKLKNIQISDNNININNKMNIPINKVKPGKIILKI